MNIDIRLRFFASLRESLGDGETVVVQAPTTVGAVRDLLRARGEPYATQLAPQRAVRAALDQVLCRDTDPVTTACELAFFPPVTGG